MRQVTWNQALSLSLDPPPGSLHPHIDTNLESGWGGTSPARKSAHVGIAGFTGPGLAFAVVINFPSIFHDFRMLCTVQTFHTY